MTLLFIPLTTLTIYCFVDSFATLLVDFLEAAFLAAVDSRSHWFNSSATSLSTNLKPRLESIFSRLPASADTDLTEAEDTAAEALDGPSQPRRAFMRLLLSAYEKVDAL